MDIFTRTVFCSPTAALWAWPYTGVTGKLRNKLQYPASPLSRQNINNHSLNESIIQGEWLPSDHPSFSPAGSPESPEDGGPGLCGPGEAGGHHQGPGGAGHGGDQSRGCPLLPQVSSVFTEEIFSEPFSNLLHTSGPNVSKDRRWNLVLAYNQGI